jgi:hypothetical protein
VPRLSTPVQSVRCRSSSPSPAPRISKMDKYFHTAYDPRLDLGEVPKEGVIASVGWDNMLAILKERGKKVCLSGPSLSPYPSAGEAADVPVHAVEAASIPHPLRRPVQRPSWHHAALPIARSNQ